VTTGAGLCDSCAFQRVVKNTRGSTFSLCERSKTEPDRFPRYPRIPVVRCDGYEPSDSARERASSAPAES
jgi:hypothetical protein